MEPTRNAELDIISAARKVFHKKGYKEATMREIASEANINMAMLHYYYRSKDNLFYIIFEESFRMLYENISVNISNPGTDIFEKIRLITKEYISFFNSQPSLPQFIIGEAIRNPENIGRIILNKTRAPKIFKVFSDQLKVEYTKGTIKQISSFSLIHNILSLCAFPVVAKPVIQNIFSFNNASMDEILKSREDEVADFIISAIRV
jgi:AcrR family transcriptional regulator